MTLSADEDGGCSRGFYHTSADIQVRLDLSDPVQPTLTLDTQSVHTSGSFDGRSREVHTPQWGRTLQTLRGALIDSPSGGELTWGFWLAREERWAFSGYPSEAQKADAAQHVRAPANEAPDLTMTCTHRWLDLSGADRAVTLTCALTRTASGDLNAGPIDSWPINPKGAQGLHLTQEAAGLEGSASSHRFGADEGVTWRRPAPAAPKGP